MPIAIPGRRRAVARPALASDSGTGCGFASRCPLARAECRASAAAAGRRTTAGHRLLPGNGCRRSRSTRNALPVPQSSGCGACRIATSKPRRRRRRMTGLLGRLGSIVVTLLASQPSSSFPCNSSCPATRHRSSPARTVAGNARGDQRALRPRSTVVVQYFHWLTNAIQATSACRCASASRWRASCHEAAGHVPTRRWPGLLPSSSASPPGS